MSQQSKGSKKSKIPKLSKKKFSNDIAADEPKPKSTKIKDKNSAKLQMQIKEESKD